MSGAFRLSSTRFLDSCESYMAGRITQPAARWSHRGTAATFPPHETTTDALDLDSCRRTSYREPGGPILRFDSVGECGDYYRQGMTQWAIAPVTLLGGTWGNQCFDENRAE